MRSKAWYADYGPHFWANLVTVKGPEECWPAVNLGARGYGAVTFKGRTIGAHVKAFELARGTTVPVGMQVCHRCDNPPCCNPDHLFLGTRKDNAADANQKGRLKHKPQRDYTNTPRGSKVKLSKLTETQVSEIREARRAGQKGCVLAVMYGVTPTLISAITTGRIWRHTPIGQVIRFDKGETHHRAVFTDAQAKWVREQASKGESCRSLARKIGVSPSTVARCCRGDTWKHL